MKLSATVGMILLLIMNVVGSAIIDAIYNKWIGLPSFDKICIDYEQIYELCVCSGFSEKETAFGYCLPENITQLQIRNLLSKAYKQGNCNKQEAMIMITGKSRIKYHDEEGKCEVEVLARFNCITEKVDLIYTTIAIQDNVSYYGG